MPCYYDEKGDGLLVSQEEPSPLAYIGKILERCWENIGKMMEKCWKDVGKMLGVCRESSGITDDP